MSGRMTNDTLGLVTPYTGLSLAESRTWRTGARWKVAPETTFGVEATRNDGQGEAGPVNALQLRAEVRW